MKMIEITVTPEGKMTVQTKGFTGQTCKAASAFLEKALGTVLEDKPTTAAEETQTGVAQCFHN